MRRFSLCVIALFALTVTVSASELDTWQSKATDKAEPSIVAIKVGRATKTTGTGVIIDERGYIVTNNHVLANAKRVQVRLSNGTELIGTVIWGEAAYDLAVIQVQAGKSLPALDFAPTASLKRGHKVLAIGHPYGFDYSVSDGIISYLGRSIPMSSGDVLSNMIQTTAPINPGNSGGPLLNEKGELIGINTALRDGAQNIAFAINASTVKEILNKNKNLASLKLAGIQGGSNAGAGRVVSLGTTGPAATTVPVALANEAR